MFSQSVSVGELPVALPSLAQDSGSQKFAEKPLGSAGQTARHERVGKTTAQVGKKSSQPVEDVILNMKSMLAQIEKQVSRSPSAKAPSDKREFQFFVIISAEGRRRESWGFRP